MSQSDFKVQQSLTEVLRKVEADKKHQQYLQSKEREAITEQTRQLKSLERQLKKAQVKPMVGKMKMLRSVLPESKK